MLLFGSIIVSIIIIILLFLSSLFFPSLILEEKNLLRVRKIHDGTVIKIGGLTLLGSYACLFIIDNLFLNLIFIASLIVMIIGLIDDLTEIIPGPTRALFIFLVALILVHLTDIQIKGIDSFFIDKYILSYNFAAILFASLCLLMLTNGFNLIDGQHGLMTGVGIIIMLNFLLLVPEHVANINEIITSILYATCVLFLFNFFTGKIMSGDCGSNFLGFIIGSLVMYIYNIFYINPYFIACILFYPVIEILFTYIRRIIANKNPFDPDNKHLHSYLYIFLTTQKIFLEVSKNNLNRLTSIIILCYFLITIVIVNKYGNIIGYSTCLFINILSYLFFYYFLKRKLK